MPKVKTYDVPLTAMEMFYVRKAVREFTNTLNEEMHYLRLMDPVSAQDEAHINEALFTKSLQVERLESALDKMLVAGAANENPYL